MIKPVLVGFLLPFDRMLSITSRRTADRERGRREILISGASANKTDTSKGMCSKGKSKFLVYGCHGAEQWNAEPVAVSFQGDGFFAPE